jgi:hypothetical protein
MHYYALFLKGLMQKINIPPIRIVHIVDYV